MDDAAAAEVKKRLDAELADADRNVGVAFGKDLYREFVSRKWIASERSTILGLPGDTFPPIPMPAYGTHYAFESDEVGDGEFKVGGRRQR